jgi:hydroxypyruvate isomerase
MTPLNPKPLERRVKQSFSWDGFARTGIDPRRLARVAAEIGYQGVDLVPSEQFSLVRDHGLEIVCAVGHPLAPDGLNRRENFPDIERFVRQNLETAARWDISNLLVFSGNRYGIDEHIAAEITAENLYRLAKLADDFGVTLLLELLNSKAAGRDYQADHTAWAVKVCKMVASPRVKILYDIFHMQIMEGDIISTIRQNAAFFGHYHTAGNPGRNDLDADQEIYYPAIIKAILATGYTGFVGHEFFPKGDAIAALQMAFEVCDVRVTI